MFSTACTVLLNIIDEGNVSQRANADSVYDAITSFNFVFVLHLMKMIIEIRDSLCQALQKNTQDIISAMSLVSSTQKLLQLLRDDTWDNLRTSVVLFCQKRNIEIPDMKAKYIDRKRRARNQLDTFTIEHYYRIDIFYAAIDSQIQEINGRFSESAMELLVLSSALNPRGMCESFKIQDICLLLNKYYPDDFTSGEKLQLEMQLQHYEHGVVNHFEYKSLSSISELCQWLVKTGMSVTHNLVFQLIVLVLTLSVSTATSERSFSAMNIVKTSLRSKMDDGYLADTLMMYIKREIAQTTSNEEILEDFGNIKERTVPFK